MVKGKVVEWYDSKGYGFIYTTDGNTKVFLHASKIKSSRRPKLGDDVKFEVTQDNRGRYNAANVMILGTKFSFSTVSFSAIYLALSTVAVYELGGEKLFVAIYFILSGLTYLMYAVDKTAAQNGQWRIAESNLHLLSLLGGWPGALFAQSKLRHKSKKQPFKLILWMTIFVNIGAFYWTFTMTGVAFVEQIMSKLHLLLAI